MIGHWQIYTVIGLFSGFADMNPVSILVFKKSCRYFSRKDSTNLEIVITCPTEVQIHDSLGYFHGGNGKFPGIFPVTNPQSS